MHRPLGPDFLSTLYNLVLVFNGVCTSTCSVDVVLDWCYDLQQMEQVFLSKLTWTTCCCLGMVWSDTLKQSGSFKVSTSSRLQHCTRGTDGQMETRARDDTKTFTVAAHASLSFYFLWTLECFSCYTLTHRTEMWKNSHKYVCAVDKLLQSLLGDQQHLIKQEERSLLFHSLDLKGTFQNQFSKPTEVWSSPIYQQWFNFLWGRRES